MSGLIALGLMWLMIVAAKPFFENAKANIAAAFNLNVGGNAKIEGAQINAGCLKGHVAGNLALTSLQNKVMENK